MEKLISLKTILLDLDGVLWRGSDPILNIRELFNRIEELGFQVFCITNNSTSSVDVYLEKLNGFGVRLKNFQVITSAEAAAAYLVEQFPLKGSLFVVGEEDLKVTLKKQGFFISEMADTENVLAVVAGLDRALTYQKINQAAKLISRGALFLGTNPDKTIPTPDGNAPGAGAVISSIEAASGQKAIIIGKPERYMFSLALSRAGSTPEDTIMVGDRLDTDILGAQRMGMHTGLVLSGISNRQDGESWDPEPDIIAEDGFEILEVLARK